MATRAESALQRLFDVRDARVVVTGAASGVGLAFAEVLGDCGARVTLTDVDAATLEESTGRLRERGADARSMVLDVTDETAVRAAMAAVAEEHGGIDVVFANAGIATGPGIDDPVGRVEGFDRSSWDRVRAVNLDGVFFTVQAAAAVMRPQRSGRIVVTASIAGLRPEPRFVDYGYMAAKAGVLSLVRQAALDLAPDNVLVNAIAPGPFAGTRIGGPGPAPPEIVQAWADSVPLGRMGDLEEIKGLALLLASPASSFITGAVYPIDGGALVAIR
jgi:NAD(P)-dependent dehydrogenase (short-subunit alcohol dehydrogenase family)